MLNNSSRIKEKVEAESNMQDVQLLIENMHRSKEPFLHCAVFIEMAAGNDKALELLQGDVAAILNRHKILYDKLFLQQKEGMISAMPTGQNLFENQFERVPPASSVANMFPFSYSGKTDPQECISAGTLTAPISLLILTSVAKTKPTGTLSYSVIPAKEKVFF